MAGRVEVDGLRELHRALRKYEPDVAKGLRRELKQVAEAVARDARGRAPRLTGALGESVKARSNIKGAEVASRSPYAGITEFGGRHPVFGRDRWAVQPARPFIRPAVEAKRDNVRREVERLLESTARRLNL